MSGNTGLFGNIAKVTPSVSTPYFEPGGYRLRVASLQVGNSQKGKGAFFAATFDILESTRADRPPGSRMGQVMFFSTGDVVLGNIKALVAAILEVPHDQITPPVMESVVGGDGTITAGREVYAEAVMVKTKAQTDFTKVNWTSPKDWVAAGRTLAPGNTISILPKPPAAQAVPHAAPQPAPGQYVQAPVADIAQLQAMLNRP